MTWIKQTIDMKAKILYYQHKTIKELSVSVDLYSKLHLNKQAEYEPVYAKKDNAKS